MDMSINQRLGRFLFEKNLTQEQLRVKLGLKARQQISNWINCHAPIPDKHLIEIIRLFPDLDANWLIHDIGNPLVDQKTLRQINRNEYGFCDECLKKEKEIEMLRSLLDKKEKEIKEMYKEFGKMEERLDQYEKTDSSKPKKKK